MGNPMEVKPITDAAFRKYGRLVDGLDVAGLLEKMKATPLPEDSTVYVASDPVLEGDSACEAITYSLFGGMPVQIGYCNGNNHKLNAVEYHRNSEINIPETDAIFIVGMQQDIEDDFTYDTSKMEAFYAPAGSVIELYATTLHYAPCNGKDGGFRVIVVLPKGTNTDIESRESATAEDRLLFARNKWLIAHEEAGLEGDGAFVGLKGENLCV